MGKWEQTGAIDEWGAGRRGAALNGPRRARNARPAR